MHVHMLEHVQHHATKYILNDYVSNYKPHYLNPTSNVATYILELNDIIFLFIYSFIKDFATLSLNKSHNISYMYGYVAGFRSMLMVTSTGYCPCMHGNHYNKF